jgi:predicted phage-related endonuclease
MKKYCKNYEGAECGYTICCGHCPKLNLCDAVCDWYKEESNTCECNEDTDQLDFAEAHANLLKEITATQIAVKAYEERLTELKEQLKDIMTVEGLDAVENDSVTVKYVKPSTRTSVDTKALKKDMPDIFQKYSKTTDVAGSLRLTLKKK